MEPGVALVAYDRIAQNGTRKGNTGLLGAQQVFSMRVSFSTGARDRVVQSAASELPSLPPRRAQEVQPETQK